MKAIFLPLLAISSALLMSPASAFPAGERHLMASDASAALRDADHRDNFRVTVWYPAQNGAREQRIDLGPPGPLLFKVGASAPGAGFADAAPKPVVLFSHGYGGT